MALALNLPKARIRQFCESHGVRRMIAFGSVVRDDFGAESDVDLLVEFEPGERVGLLRVAGLEMELSRIIGRQVDLSVKGRSPSPFADAVSRSGEMIYDR